MTKLFKKIVLTIITESLAGVAVTGAVTACASYIHESSLAQATRAATLDDTTTVEGGLTTYSGGRWGTSSSQTITTATAGIQGSTHTYIGSTLFTLPMNQNEDWGLPQNDLYHLYFASWSTGTGMNVSLVGYEFMTSARINLTMQDQVIDQNGVSHSVTEIYGIAGGSTSDRGIFSYSEKLTAYDYACKQLYGFSSNNVMTYLPDRAFYFCPNLMSVHLGRNMNDPQTNDSHASYIFGCVSTLSPSLITVDPLNTNLKVKQCKVNNVIGIAVLQNNSSNIVFGNTLCAGAINASDIFTIDGQGHIELPIMAFDSSWSIVSMNLNKVNKVGERCFYNCPYIQDVYLYEPDYNDWTWKLGSGSFGSGRGNFTFYYPYVTTSHEEDYSDSGTNGALNWRTIIHLPSRTTDAQLTEWRLHYSDQKIGSDSVGMFGLENPSQIIVEPSAASMEVIGPLVVTTRPQMTLTNWYGQAYLSSGELATSNFVWTITGLPGGSINPNTGYVTAPTNSSATDVTYENVTITAVSLDDPSITDSITVTIIVTGTNNKHPFDLLGPQFIETNFSNGANASYVISKGGETYDYDTPVWDMSFDSTSPSTNGITINQNGLLVISQTVPSNTYTIKIVVTSKVTERDSAGDAGGELYSDIEVVIVVYGKSISIDTPTELEFYHRDGIKEVAISADYNISNEDGVINWQSSTPGVEVVATDALGRTATISIDTNQILPGTHQIIIKASDNTGIETISIINLTLNNLEINIEGSSLFSFNRYRSGETTTFHVLQGDIEITADSWTIEYYTNDAWSDVLPSGITWDIDKFLVSGATPLGNFQLRLIAHYSVISSEPFTLTINVFQPSLVISGNSIIAVEYSVPQVQNYTGSLNCSVNDGGDNTYSWSVTGTDASHFSNSHGTNDDFYLEIPMSLMPATEYHINVVATPNDTALAPITAIFPVTLVVEDFSMTTTATSSQKGLTGMILYAVQGVQKRVQLSTVTSSAGEIVTYRSNNPLPFGINLGGGQLTIDEALEVETETGYYQMEIRVVGSTERRSSTINFVVRTVQSSVDVTCSANKTFIDGVGGSVNFTSFVNPSDASYGLNNTTLWNIEWTNPTAGYSSANLPAGFSTTNITTASSAMDIEIGTNAHTGVYDFTVKAIADHSTDSQLSMSIVGTYVVTITINDPIITIVPPNADNLLTHYRGMNWQPHKFNASTTPNTLNQVVDWSFPLDNFPPALTGKVSINQNSGWLSCISDTPVGTYNIVVQAARHDDPHVKATYFFTLKVMLPELTIRGPRVINCDSGNSYEQYRYVPGGSTQTDNYLGEIKWHISSSLSKYIEFNEQSQTLGVHVKKITWLHVLIFPLTASTADGEVVAKINITINVEKEHELDIMILCIILIVISLLVQIVLITIFRIRRKI